MIQIELTWAILWIVIGFVVMSISYKIGVYDDFVKNYEKLDPGEIGVISLTLIIWPYMIACYLIGLYLGLIRKK